MKKTYTKPDIMFDSFSMCSSIAAACEVEATFARNQCGVEMTESISIFADGVTDCAWKISDSDESFNYLCYHVPSDNYNVFNS
jgi:hypothetical protein